MSELFTKAKEQFLIYWLVVAYILLFSFGALSTCILASLIGADWKSMDTQGRVMIVLAVFSNWASILLAFFNKAAARLQKGDLPISPDDTQLIPKPK